MHSHLGRPQLQGGQAGLLVNAGGCHQGGVGQLAAPQSQVGSIEQQACKKVGGACAGSGCSGAPHTWLALLAASCPIRPLAGLVPATQSCSSQLQDAPEALAAGRTWQEVRPAPVVVHAREQKEANEADDVAPVEHLNVGRVGRRATRGGCWAWKVLQTL